MKRKVLSILFLLGAGGFALSARAESLFTVPVYAFGDTWGGASSVSPTSVTLDGDVHWKDQLTARSDSPYCVVKEGYGRDDTSWILIYVPKNGYTNDTLVSTDMWHEDVINGNFYPSKKLIDGLGVAFTALVYTVTFDANGGAAPSPAAKSVTFDAAYGDLAAVSRPGYSFTGWFTRPSEGTVARADTIVKTATNHVLYAHWQANDYVVHFDAAGGTGGAVVVTNVYDALPDPVAVPSRKDYSFDGYFYGDELCYGPDGQMTNGWNVAEDVTLVAHWSALPTVSFDNCGGTGGPDSFAFVYGEALESIEPPTRKGYYFNGYYTLEGGRGTCYWGADGRPVQQTWSDKTSLTLCACWEISSYAVIYERNAPDGFEDEINDSRKFSYGTYYYLEPNEFSCAGYTFAGWNTCADGMGVDYADNARVRSLSDDGGDVFLYAQWTPNHYAVTFAANGGTGEMPPQDFTYGVAAPLARNGFTRRGFTFAGWTTNGADVAFADGESVSNLTTIADATVALSALWTDVRYDVVYDAGSGLIPVGDAASCKTIVTNLVPGEAYPDVAAPTNANSHLTFAKWAYVAAGVTNDLPATIPYEADGVTNVVALWAWAADDIAKAVDAPELEFTTEGWTVAADDCKVGSSSGFGGDLTAGRLVVSAQTTVSGPGTLSFWWKVDAAGYNSDILNFTSQGCTFFVDEERKIYLTGSSSGDYVGSASSTYVSASHQEDVIYPDFIGWTNVVFAVEGEGEHVVKWTFESDGYDFGGGAWVDGVKWTSAGGEPTTTPTHNVPVSWAQTYCPSVTSAAEAEAFVEGPSPAGKTHADGSPFYVWEDYVAGTDPTNAASLFRAFISFTNGVPCVTWDPDLREDEKPRDYAIEGKTRLSADEEWQPVAGNEDKFNFFRVNVLTNGLL